MAQRAAWTVVHVAVIAGLAIVDSVFASVEFRPLYSIPVITGAFTAGAVPGLALAVVAGLAVLIVDDGALSKPSTLLPAIFALGAVRLVVNGVIALAVARVAEQDRALRREAKAREQYVGLVAHEVRNPLLAIRAAALGLARGRVAAADVERTAAAIAEEAQAGTSLLDDLTELAHVESAHPTLVLRPVDLTSVVRSIASAIPGSDHPITLRGGSAPITVLGDEQRLAQVIRNLLGNAAKYSPAGSGIEVSVGVAPDRHTAVVSVRDHGPGIPPGERGRLFSKFERLSTAGSTRGSGLGLYISRRLAQLHHGDLALDNVVDGSEFTLTLPLADRR